MTTTTTSLANPIGSKIIIDLEANAVPEDAAITGAATLYQIRIDNTNNTNPVYLKILDATSATAGSSEPNFVLECPASSKASMVSTSGLALSNGLSFWCVTTNDVQGVTPPTNAVEVRILAS